MNRGRPLPDQLETLAIGYSRLGHAKAADLLRGAAVRIRRQNVELERLRRTCDRATAPDGSHDPVPFAATASK